MATRKKIISFTVLVWCLITLIYAYLYVTTVLSFPDLEGYEAEWDWQLMFFAIVRLPWMLIALALIIWAEIKLLKK